MSGVINLATSCAYKGWEALPSLTGPSRAAQLEQAVFAHGPALPNVEARLLSGYATDTRSMVSNYPGLVQLFQKLFVMTYSVSGGSLVWLANAFSSSDSALGAHALSMSSTLYTIIGPMRLFDVFKDIAYADAIEDRRGSLLGRISAAANAGAVGVGFSLLSFRPLAALSTTKGIKANSLTKGATLGRVTYGCMLLSSAFYAIYFFCLSVVLAVKAYDGSSLRSALNEKKTLAEKVAYLEDRMRADPHKVYEGLVEKYENKGFSPSEAKLQARQELIDEAYEAGKAGLKKLMKEADVGSVSNEKLRLGVYQIMEKTHGAWLGSSETGVNNALFAKGLAMRTIKQDHKNWAELNRVLGNDGIAAMKEIRSAKGLSRRVNRWIGSQNAVAQELVDRVDKSAQKMIWIHVVSALILAVSIPCLFLSLLPVGGSVAIALMAVIILDALAMTGLDLYSLMKSYGQDLPAKHDRKFLALSSGVAVASFGALIALSATGVASFGVIPLVIAAVLTGLWLAHNAATLFVIGKNERAFYKNHPTLKSYAKALDKGASIEEEKALFARLPWNVQKEIKIELPWTSEGKRGAVQRVIEKIQRVKEARNERLRRELMPLFITA